MYIYTCKHQWEDMLTCIYEAWCSRKGQQNIRLEFEPVEQYTLFYEYIHVKADKDKAEKVSRAIQERISKHVYRELSMVSMAYESDSLDIIYRVLLLGFALGADVLNMVQYREVVRFGEIRHRVGREIYRFQEIVRFQEPKKDFFVAHIEPKSRLVAALGPIFSDRMPSEDFIIVDDCNREALIHPKDEMFFLKQLDDREFEILRDMEKTRDQYTDMWEVFFRTIAIEQRENPKCQANLFPLWSRKHAVEFMSNDKV